MAFQFKMPDIGEGIAEGEIVKIDIKVGDTIQEDDILFEVQNDKSVEEIPSPVAGTVTAVLVSEGTVAHVGDVTLKSQQKAVLTHLQQRLQQHLQHQLQQQHQRHLQLQQEFQQQATLVN